ARSSPRTAPPEDDEPIGAIAHRASASPAHPDSRGKGSEGGGNPPPSVLRRLGAYPDELLHAPPGIGRGLLELVVLPVEEAVRRPGIDRRVVTDPRALARGLELVDVGLRDALVGAPEDRQHRTF